MPGRFDEKSGSKFTRMLVSQDLGNLNIRREQLAHITHYKVNVHEMKRKAKEAGRPIRILNVGCGEVNELRLFYAADHTQKSTVIKSYLGIDGDSKVIAATAERAATVLRGVNGTLEACDITSDDFPCKPGSMDLVICNEVLEHIPEKKVPRVLRAIRRAARSTATIVISTPNKDGTNEKLPADHVYEWRYEELKEEFQKAGLAVVDELGVYIKKSNLMRWLKDNAPDKISDAESVWERFGLDLGSMMTADLAIPVANNVIYKLKKV